MHHERIRNSALRKKIMTADEAAQLIEDGMVLGMSGFTSAGDAKEVPLAMARKAQKKPFKVSLLTGASLGYGTDKVLCDAGITARRYPFQADRELRGAINQGKVMYSDIHLSELAESLRGEQMKTIDCALVEAVAITEEGGIVPSSSVGVSPTFIRQAKKVIVELNTALSPAFEGMHDIYEPQNRPGRAPVEILNVSSRVGTPYIPVDPEKIAAIVVTHKPDCPSPVLPPDEETNQIARHLIHFFEKEVQAGRLGSSLQPLQSGVGTIANAVLTGLIDSPFHNLVMYSEVLQDCAFALFEAGKLDFASATSITLSEGLGKRIYENIHDYKDRILLRPQEISNFPEIIRRLGIIAINTALEFDIYGNVNSTHVNGTHMMNGIGGSGDFARNAFMSVFVTKSIAKGGKISSVVPMVAHVDHTEHDVDILVTEVGLADLRGLAPRERAKTIIENCVHPSFKAPLYDYFVRACETRGGQTPHILEEALSWHKKAMDTGSML